MKGEGIVKYSNDTLYLEKEDIGFMGCSSTEFATFQYVIYNPENKNFIIVTDGSVID